MSDDKSHAASDKSPVNKGDSQRSDSILLFFNQIKQILPADFLKQHVRSTPYGLFVADQGKERVVESYQKWLAETTHGEIQKSPAKCFKRLFDSLDPPRSYLMEGKVCLSGSLIKHQISEPQKMGIPYFLGSLSDMRTFIHPNDPVLVALEDVETRSVADGLEFIFRNRAGQFIVTSAALAEFASMASRSAHILRIEPGLTASLAVALRALIKLLSDSRQVMKHYEFLIPAKFNNLDRFSFRNVGSLTFVFDQQNRMLTCYDLRSGNLFRFVQREFSAFTPKRIGSFEVFGPKVRALGSFHFGRSEYLLMMRTFVEFLGHLRNSPDKREHFSKAYTVRDCFDRFSEIFQMSAPIERHKIQNQVGHVRKRVREFRINGPWIFAISSRGEIEGCIAKHAQQRRAPQGRRRQ